MYFALVLAFGLLLAPSFLNNHLNAMNITNDSNETFTNQTIPELEKGMYVIIGTFQIRENAIKYANSIQETGKPSSIGHYNKKNMFYIYAYYTLDDLEYAREKRSELRATNKFYDAWILYVGLSISDFKEKESSSDAISNEQIDKLNPEFIKEQDTDMSIPVSPVKQDQNLYNYRFNVISATTLKEVPGYITIIDAARNKAMQSVSTNQIHQLEAPTTESKEIIAQCDIFGFVKEQVKFNIEDPISTKDKNVIGESGGITTVKFELARHKVGEMLTMYHVYFYTDAAIMKPESKFELNSLLGMLKENDKLEIRIHGHTNGNAAGKIIRLSEDDKNYFSVGADNVEGMGSAKELSKARAEVIAQWLIDQGISKKRMDIKAWGGKKMIYKKNDPMAGKNVRVEIEILKG